jgi:hypothetical protein
MLIGAASEPLADPAPSDAPEGTVAVLRGQMLLQALDFWLRNPDYLADELLKRYEAEGDLDDLTRAGEILDSDEPEVRSYPMLRYLFGAYEPLDEALSVLRSPGFDRDTPIARRSGQGLAPRLLPDREGPSGCRGCARDRTRF